MVISLSFREGGVEQRVTWFAPFFISLNRRKAHEQSQTFSPTYNTYFSFCYLLYDLFS